MPESKEIDPTAVPLLFQVAFTPRGGSPVIMPLFNAFAAPEVQVREFQDRYEYTIEREMEVPGGKHPIFFAGVQWKTEPLIFRCSEGSA